MSRSTPWKGARGPVFGRFPFDQKFRDFRSETEWKGKNSGKSVRKSRNTFWVHPLWWNFRNYRDFCVPFARDVGFSLPTERELTWTLEKAINGGRSSISMLSVWLCVERFQSFSTASMQQFVSFIQQRYVTLTSTFARRSSVPTVLPFC